MKNKLVIAGLAVVIAIGAFFAGSWYQQQQRRNQFQAMANGQRSWGGQGQGPMGGGRGQGFPGGQTGAPLGGQRGAGMRQRVLSARVDVIDGDELTLTTQFGSVKVKLGDKTEFEKAAAAKQGDIKKGADVIIETEADDSGNLTAKTVTIK
jgi:hypothetical protein